MADDRKGISLRKKKGSRPKISAPRPVDVDNASETQSQRPKASFDGAPLQRTETSQSSLRGRPSMQGADRTADLVKRRYSTRFVGYPMDAGMPPPVPSMPALPAEYQNGRGHSRSRSRGSPERQGKGLRVDVRALRDPDLVPEQYISRILSDADETDVSNYQAELRKLKSRTETDLQHNVYQNRTQFIKISKEAEKLKAEMRTLRVLMTDLTSGLNQAAQAGGADVSNMSVADRKRANRSSVANLEALWSTHLQTLWKRVEGSQKYLPAVSGRHILYESSRWVELNAATWKPQRRVHMILLNDNLLIAVEKKRSEGASLTSPQLSSRRSSGMAPGTSGVTLVADRCYALQDVQMTDISRSTSKSRSAQPIANAISVRVGTESFTFATGTSNDSVTEKNSLMVSYRKAHEELRKSLAAGHSERERALDEPGLLSPTYPYRSNTASPLHSPGLGGDRKFLAKSATLIDVDGRQQPLRWIENQIDSLDIDIALQNFEDAVARTEKLRRLARSIRGNNAAQELFTAKIDERAERLAGVICRRLRQDSAGLEKTKRNVGWLVRLGADEVAVREYLGVRTEVVRMRTRQLPFTGALPPYVTALSYVTFTLILHTMRVFTASFPGSSNTSAAVKWAKERVDDFNAALGRQIGGLGAVGGVAGNAQSVGTNSDVARECVRIAREQCSVLREVGVDFEGLVGRFEGNTATNDASNEDGGHGASPTDDAGRRLGSKGVGVGKNMFA